MEQPVQREKSKVPVSLLSSRAALLLNLNKLFHERSVVPHIACGRIGSHFKLWKSFKTVLKAHLFLSMLIRILENSGGCSVGQTIRARALCMCLHRANRYRA